MLLGALRPQRPWRWTLLVAVFVPLVQLAAYVLLTEKPYRAQIYESFLGFLTGIAGAYGGATASERIGRIVGEVRSADVSCQLSAFSFTNHLVSVSAEPFEGSLPAKSLCAMRPESEPIHCRPR